MGMTICLGAGAERLLVKSGTRGKDEKRCWGETNKCDYRTGSSESVNARVVFKATRTYEMRETEHRVGRAMAGCILHPGQPTVKKQ